MAGDSDDEFLPEEEEDGEVDFLPVTSQELRLLRQQERQRQLIQNSREDALQEDDIQQPAGDAARLPLPPIPPFPTPPFAGSLLPEEEEEEDQQPYLPPPQAPPLAAWPAAASPGSARRRTDPFTTRQAPGPAGVQPWQAASSSSSSAGWLSFRHHSYWLIPLLLVAVFSLLLLLTRPQYVLGMAFIFAAIGVIQAAVLLYAPKEAYWALGVIGGLLVFLIAAFFALFQPIFAVILSILLLCLAGLALRDHYFPVKEGTVAVMGLFGKYHRTLQPGLNLRFPGEKLLGVVETHKLRCEARLLPIALFSGEQVTLNVAMSYQVVTGEEHLAIRTTRDWQTLIKQQLQAVVQDVVSVLSLDDFRYPGAGYPPSGTYSASAADEFDDDQDASPLERLNERLTEAMREQVADRGVAVHAVRARLLEGPHMLGGAQPPGAPVPAAHPTTLLPSMPQGAGQAAGSAPPGTASAGLPGQPLLPAQSPGPTVAPPPVGGAPPPTGGPPEPMTLRSAQALAEIYDAVLHQRITDLATIQRIVSQFEAVASDPELSQLVPFDAAAGAQNLINHLHNLQMRAYATLAQRPDGDSSFPSGSPAAPAGPEE